MSDLHKIVLCSPTGKRYATINEWTSLTYSLSANDEGAIDVGLSTDTDPVYLAQDNIIEVWLRPYGEQRWSHEASYFIMEPEIGERTDGALSYLVHGRGLENILGRGIVRQIGINPERTMTFTNTPTTGKFKLNFGGQITEYMNATATGISADQVQTQLAKLSNIGSGNVRVTKDGLDYQIVLVNDLGNTPNSTSLTAQNNTLAAAGPVSTSISFVTVAVGESPVHSGPADDVMKEFVDLNLGPSAGTGRDRSAAGFTIDPDFSKGPSISTQNGNQKVLAALQDIGQQAAKEGTVPVFFRVVRQGFDPEPCTFPFRTYYGLIGMDRREDVLLTVRNGGLSEGRVITSYTDVENYIYAAGSGYAADRIQAEVYDQDSINESPWGRREGFFNASDVNSTATLTSQAKAYLHDKRARRRFQGTIAQTGPRRYGLDYHFGDIISVQVGPYVYAMRIDGVTVTVDQQGASTIDVRLEEVP